MKTQYVKQDGVVNGIDFDAHYQVKGYRGIAFYVLGWLAENRPIMCYVNDEEGNKCEVESGEFELEANTDYVVAVMVGDDRRHTVEVSDLIPLKEDGFCRSCGQVGCGCNVYA